MKIQLSDHFTYPKLFRFVLPSIITMVFTSIYGVVDGLFVSNWAGKTAFASINLIMPFLMLMAGIGFMMGTGGSALVAMTLGQGKKHDANRYFTMIITATVIGGLILTIVGNIFMRPVAIRLGATPDMIDDCVLYGRLVNSFNAAFMLQYLFQSFFVVAEKPKLGLYTTIAAGLTNMALYTQFVAGYQWGLVGAALATGISQCVGGVLPLFYFLRPNSSVLRLVKTRIEMSIILKAASNGASELMSNIASAIVSMLYNFQLMRLIGEDGVAAYGVLMYVCFIFVAIDIGYAVGAAPIVGYHFGAGNHDELHNMLMKSLEVMASLGVIMVMLADVLAGPISQVFVGYDQGLYDLTVHAFRLFSYSFLLSGLNIYCSSFFTALNNGAVSAAISFLRTLLFQSSCVILFPILFGTDGIWLSITAAEAFALIISAAFLIKEKAKYHY